jgi:transcriptional antiterminator
MSSEERRKTLLQFDKLIRKKTIGNCDVIADKLGISRRTVFRLITYMREELNAPIIFDNEKQRYAYQYTGSIIYSFVHNNGKR